MTNTTGRSPMPPRKARYFDNRTGRELSSYEAFSNGVMRDGVIMRTRMMARDARTRFTDARSYWDAERDNLLVTDARRIGGVEGNRPGFRVLDNDFGRAAKEAAYRDHERYLNGAYKNAETLTDAGEGGEVGPGDENDSAEARRANSRSIERIAQDHRRNMQRIYDAHARELENAWRANK
jgi:hypothetical protein